MSCSVFVETTYLEVIHVLCCFAEIMYRQLIHVLCYFRGDPVSTGYSWPVPFSRRPCIDMLVISFNVFDETIYREIIHVLSRFR